MLTFLLLSLLARPRRASRRRRARGMGGRPRSGPAAFAVLLVVANGPKPAATADLWPVLRAGMNLAVTVPAVVWGLARGGRLEVHGPGLVVVAGMHGGAGPREGLLIGNAYLTEMRSAQFRHGLLDHEIHHADQWAVLGPALLPPLYAFAEVAGEMFTDCGRGGNVFEIEAGLTDGGYDSPAEQRCSHGPAPADRAPPPA